MKKLINKIETNGVNPNYLKLKKAIFLFLFCGTGMHLVREGKECIQNVQLERELEYIKQNPLDAIVDSTIEVATVNMENKYWDETGEQMSANLINSLIKDEVDLIGTQENKRNTVEILKQQISKLGYTTTGEYRFGKGLIGKIFDIANESNSIVSKNNIYISETVLLSFLPENLKELKEGIQSLSIMPRIATHVIVETEMGYIHMLNTHLDYSIPSIQKRQMNDILCYIDKQLNQFQAPLVLTGDFNATIDSENMKYFINELSLREIKVVFTDVPTYKGNGIEPPSQKDYICFSTDQFECVGKMVYENPNSDHDAVLVKLKYCPEEE